MNLGPTKLGQHPVQDPVRENRFRSRLNRVRPNQDSDSTKPTRRCRFMWGPLFTSTKSFECGAQVNFSFRHIFHLLCQIGSVVRELYFQHKDHGLIPGCHLETKVPRHMAHIYQQFGLRYIVWLGLIYWHLIRFPLITIIQLLNFDALDLIGVNSFGSLNRCNAYL